MQKDKKTSLVPYFVIGLIGLGIGVLFYFKRQIFLALNYDYRIKGGKIVSFTKDRLRLSLELEVINKSDISITLTGMFFKIYINNKYVGLIENNIPQLIKGNNSFVFRLNADINPRQGFSVYEIAKLISYSLYDQTKLNIILDGYISVKKGNVEIVKNYPIKYESNLKELLEEDENE